ncbi:MAG: serine/threonine-protein kinase, partial [Gemmatimonadota bacterium]
MPDKLVDDLKRALGDAYTIERELTGGGMSRVFVAKEHALGREVVIKVLPPDLAAGVNRERFRREVQLAARLSHPYIVPLLHAGEHDELLWFTMPYIAGESLRSRLLRDGALKLPEVLKLLHDVVEALAYAHSRGVIHRDIKPGNILSDGRHALVTDFGVAKALNAALPMGGPGHTTSGMATGTSAYMAPEQLAADPEADHRVDIYAVGLLAYELLSGVSPFAAPSPTATMTAQLTRLPEPLHELHQEIPTAFSNLVQHCLAKSPEDRPPDAQAVLHELDNISGAMAADQHRSISGENGSRKRASSLPLVVATFGVLALVAGGFLWSQRGAVKQPARADSSTVRVGGDTDLAAPIQPKPLTHQDSLRIAKALQSELAQLDAGKTKASAKPAGPPPIDTAALARQLAAFDSVIKSRYAEMRRPILPPEVGRNGATAAAVGASTAVTIAQGNMDKRVMVFASPLRGRDTVMRALEAQVTGDLQKRLSGQRGYQVMPVDTTALARGR